MNKNINNNIRKRRIKRNYTKKPKYSKKKSSKGILRVFSYILLFFVVLSFLMGLVLYTKYIKDLPSVSELENYNLEETSTIYDKGGNVLYEFFNEKRTYIGFESISKNMINAIVAGEDKRYWENPGVDIIGLARAGVYFVTGKSDGKIKGTSTLTQQLIRNTIITNERSIERKVKEIYLAYKLTSGISKEKILELYLNKISFGHNSYGIEEAAKTFFDKSALELDVLESSIIASLPKGPTYYSPYNHPDRTIGYLYYFNEQNEEQKNDIIDNSDVLENKKYVDLFNNTINNLKSNRISESDEMILCGVKDDILKNNYNIDSDGCMVIEYSGLLGFLNSLQLDIDGEKLEYQTGRKDFILGRMLEDGYIDFDQYKNSIINGIGLVLNKNIEEIKSPHFVFYIKEYLEKKYGSDIISVGGLDIYTSIDPDLQKKAEEIVKNQVAKNTSKFNAKNASLVSIDNKTGEILAMVGSADYFDEENKGQVNVNTSKLQPGSSFKPFVYALAIYNSKIGSKSPVYDLKTEFSGDYEPQNFDGKFMGKIDLTTALNQSRNIPAIKMVPLAGGEKNIVDFMHKLGAESIDKTGQYGLSLGLGTAEMTPLELSKAYSVFANLGKKVEINPVLKIVDTKGNIIEEKKEVEQEQIISAAQSYIINEMLTNTNTRPPFWNNYLALSDRKVAAKTGTSNKQYFINGKNEIYPSNLWTAGYTPQITTVAWAGNTNGERLYKNASGLEAAGSIWKDYMEYAHNNLAVKSWKRPSDVKEINISEITGLLPSPDNVGSNILTKSLFVNTPTQYDNSFKKVKIDILCNGVVGPNTPDSAIREATLVEFRSIMPNRQNWEKPVQEWARSDSAKAMYGNIPNLITKVNNTTCDRGDIKSNIVLNSNIVNDGEYSIGNNYLEVAYSSSNPIVQLEILIGNDLVKTIEVDNKKTGVYSGNLFIAAKYRNKIAPITIKAVDKYYYAEQVTNTINIYSRDNNSPIIDIQNPIDKSIKLYDKDFFNLRAEVFDTSEIETIIYIDGIEKYNLGNNRRLKQEINKNNDLSLGDHVIKIESIDIFGNKSEEKIDLEVLKK